MKNFPTLLPKLTSPLAEAEGAYLGAAAATARLSAALALGDDAGHRGARGGGARPGAEGGGAGREPGGRR